ncbi:MAG: erythromycin esterase family protein [Lachnospiraceae bacterium]|nr:erythromycin esterase family protein [Lachnospiraceae bacterium]
MKKTDQDNIPNNQEKKAKAKKSRRVTWIIIAAIALILLGSQIISKLIKPAKIEGFEAAVTTIEGIEIPAGVRIVALGEATHGNKEFQELKLEVFQQLVAKTNVRALILEGDVGGCELANRYIQGGEGTAEEVTRHLGYGIYRTNQMCALVQWMHDYNQTAADADKVRLYGMDMQYDEDTIAALNAFYAKVDEKKQATYAAKFAEYLGETYKDYDSSKFDEIVALMDEIEKDIEENKAAYAQKTSAKETQYAAHLAENLKYFISYCVKEGETKKARDTYMKKNVDWILATEEAERNGAVMVSCHNGHMTKNQSTAYTFLGKFLYEEYGDAYFAIGTDYYNTEDNVPNASYTARITAKLCSDDPLAYQVGALPENKYFLDFSKVDENSALGKKIHSAIPTGSLSEAYSPLYKVVKSMTQLRQAPSDMFDAMILVYDATPIEIWPRQ